MNRQTFEILKKMINSRGKALDVTRMMERYAVSSRTFYNYINDINFYLKNAKIQGNVQLEDGMLTIDLKDEDYAYVGELMNSMDFGEYKLSNDERRKIILLILLSSNGAVKEKYLEDMLLVSRTSIINDMRFVKQQLSGSGISFKENSHEGLEIECDERKRRQITIDLLLNKLSSEVEDSFFPLNPCDSFINGYLKLEKPRIISENAIKKCEQETDIGLSDDNYYLLTVVLSYIISRLKAGNKLYREEGGVKNNKALILAEHLFASLQDITSYNYAEVEFLSEIIRKYSFLNYSSEDEYQDDSYLQLIVKDLLETLSFNLKTNLIEDSDLLSFLVAHIEGCRHRISNGENFANPFLSQVITKYKDQFDILKKHMYILENSLSISFNDDEIALILMHILASMERQKNAGYIPRIVVACGSGAATSNFLAALIRANFKVNIVSVSSLHNTLSVIEKDNVDLIVSTVPFTTPDIPVVVVDPYLKPEDKRNLQHALNAISMQEIQIDLKDMPDELNDLLDTGSRTAGLKDIIDGDLIRLECEARSWKEAIIASGELLLWEKCISVNYLQQMVQLVDRYGPYIVIAKGIAFSHASPSQGSLRNGLSIVRLNTPVPFGKSEFDPVKIVVGCSILDSPENVKLLLKIMRIIKDPSFYATVNEAKDKDDILNIFRGINNGNS